LTARGFNKLNKSVAPSAAGHESAKKPPISVDRVTGDLLATGHGSCLHLSVHGYYLLKSTLNCQAAFCLKAKNCLTLMTSSHKCWAYEKHQSHKSIKQLVVASVAAVRLGGLAI